jgi:hypothetical protein
MNARYHIKRQKVSTMPTWLLMKTDKNGKTTEASSFTSRIGLICDLCDLMFKNEISRQMIYEVIQNMPIAVPFANFIEEDGNHFAFQNNPLYQIDTSSTLQSIVDTIAKKYGAESDNVNFCACYIEQEFDGGVIFIKVETTSLIIGPEKSVQQTIYWAQVTEFLIRDIYPNYVGWFAEASLENIKKAGTEYPDHLN